MAILAALLDAEFDRQQCPAVLDVGLPERLGGWQPYAEIVRLALLHRDQFDLGLQGLSQAGKHSQLTQPCSYR